MKNKYIYIMSLVSLITLSGCNKDENNSSSSSQNNNSSSSLVSSETIDINDGKYRVKVLLPNGESAGEGINVQWCSDVMCFDATTNASGIATKELEPGTYSVKLNGYSNKYSYQLGYESTEDNRYLEITLQEILEAKADSSDTENPAGSKYNPYIVYEGVYNATVSSNDEVQYFGFIPNRPGKYVVESWGTSTNLISTDPYVNYYGNNPQYVNEVIYSDDNSGYDVNFSLEINIAIEEFVNTGTFDESGNMIYEKDSNGNYISGGIYTFGISADNVKKPKTFPFVVKWVDEYVVEKKPAEVIDVEETLAVFPNKADDYVWRDSLLNGLETVVYNQEDGFYHIDTEDGYILTAKISEPCNYFDRAFSKVVYQENGEPMLDEQGNIKNEGIVGVTGIVLDNGTKDYTNFVQEYEKYCNEDGVYGVTEELKTFLEYYFLANKDWIVSNSQTVVDDECGWMFACGYYANIADSYEKPWSGTGETSDDAYAINTGYEYYANVKENSSIFYSYFLKNSMNEIMVYIKSTNPNAKIIYNSREYSSEEGAYLELTIGGLMNPTGIIFEITTVNQQAEGIVFEFGIKEKTVAGDALTLGDNTVEVLDASYVDCKFTAPKDGTYVVTSNETNGWFDYNGHNYKGSDGEISFSANLKKGETLEFTIYTLSFTRDYITFNIACDTVAKLGVNMTTVGNREIVEYTFIVPEDGTYEIECSTNNTALAYSEAYSEEWVFGDTSSKKLTLTLKEGKEITLLVTTCDNSAGTVAFTITKI